MLLGFGSDPVGPYAPGVTPFPVGGSPQAQAAAMVQAAATASASSGKPKPPTTSSTKPGGAPAPAAPGVLGQAQAFASGLPWGWILVAIGILGGIMYLSRRPTRSNPDLERDRSPGVRRAAKFYRDFHWGRKAKKRRRVRLGPTPRELVKLGTLEAVTYAARKGKDALADYIHHFGEGGTKKPVLAADPRSKRLHIVGGGYDVEDVGITG